MAVLVLPTSSFVQQQLDALRALAPHEVFATDPAAIAPEEVEALLAFRLRPGIANVLPRLRFIASAGAGADEILATPDLPAVPVVRPVDPLQARRIAQYVTLMALRFHRELARLEAQHREHRWQRFAPMAEAQRRVGVLGYGTAGRAVVTALRALGFDVTAWRRTEASATDGVVSGADGLRALLENAQILACTLPLTPETRGLLGADTLARLPRGAFVIDVSRGGILDHAALLQAIDEGRIAGAALDVFPDEPLPAASPLWEHPAVLCTPHIAGTPRPELAARQFLDNLRRARAGEPLCHVIDRARGY